MRGGDGRGGEEMGGDGRGGEGRRGDDDDSKIRQMKGQYSGKTPSILPCFFATYFAYLAYLALCLQDLDRGKS